MGTITRMKGEILPSALTIKDLDNEDGFNMWDPQQVHPFPIAKYLDEIRVLCFIQSILEKSEWRRKMHGGEIWKKWKNEAIIQDAKFRDEMFAYAFRELEWLASSKDKISGVEPTGVDLVWKSDNLLPEGVRSRFHTLINQFENNIAPEDHDWHPNSDGKVLNLIHPSMHCLVYGESTDYDGVPIQPPVPRRPEVPHPGAPPGNGEDMNVPLHISEDWYAAYQAHYKSKTPTFWSTKFQWLPAEFLIDKSGKVKIASYINSLVPVGEVNQGLYLVLAEIFEKAVPLLNIVLTDLRNHYTRNRFYGDGAYLWWPGERPYIPEAMQEEEDEITFKRVSKEEKQVLLDNWRKKYDEWYAQQPMNILPIPEFNKEEFLELPLDPGNDEAIDLRGHQVQVIVKIGSIQLTPEKPDFDGGKWHVEGMANERIVATVIYYYDSENIEETELRFRQAVLLNGDEEKWQQDDDEGAKMVFGIERDGPMIQPAGRVTTKKGRVLCFPNMYQHQVRPFSLVDKSKPGYRKILVFFLVDPFVEGGIISTKDVPPQNKDDPRWRDAELTRMAQDRLPVELNEIIEQYLWGEESRAGFTREDAEANRLKLMEERSNYDELVDGQVFGREFSLCEH